MTIESRLYDADRAREVLENESFKWAFETTKQEIIESWTNAKSPDDRERLWLSQKLLARLEQALTNRLESGRQAKLELEHRKTIAERAREWMA